MSSEYTVLRVRNVEIYVCEASERFDLVCDDEDAWTYDLQNIVVENLTPEQLEDLAFNMLQVVAYWLPDSESVKALELVGRMDGGPRLEK